MFRTLSIAALMAATLPVAAYSQAYQPTDHQLMIEVSRTLATEPAFRGMTIIPSVQNGVVTLSGSVTSYAAKVLASTELSGINGVKTVLNNLNIGPNPPQAATAKPMTPAQPTFTSMRSLNVPAGTILPVRLVSSISSKTAQANQPFQATLLTDIARDGFVLIPRGTVFVGRIVSARSAGRFSGSAELALELVSFTLNTPQGQQQFGLISDPLTSEGSGRGKNTAVKAGGGAALGAIIGALAGGGEGAAIGALSGGALGAGTNVVRGKQIELPAEQMLQFTVEAPASVPVYLNKLNQQMIPHPATVPTLITQPNNVNQQ